MTLIQREISRAPAGEREKALKIIAKSIYKELRAYGYETNQIVGLSSELIGLVTHEMKQASAE